MDDDRETLRRESQALRQALGAFPTRRAWLASPEGRALVARLERHLDIIRRFDAPDSPGSAPPPRDWLHVVQWNVLHGRRWETVLEALRSEPALVGADLVALEETDLGLARSGNGDVAFDLARALGLYAVWTPLFLELEGGFRTPPELASRPQAESFFGLALLSRFPIGEVERVVLESPEDLLFDRERKAGKFVALVARILRPETPFTMIVAHLDVHGSPHTRLRQVRQILEVVPEGPAILAGDLNTTTFARGGWWRSARTLAVLACAPRARLRKRLLAPHQPSTAPREPLFAALALRGFEVAPFNDTTESLDVHFDEVHELDSLPPSVRRIVQAPLRFVERRNAMRLDWIAARGFAAAPERPPFALPHRARGRQAASDHAPVGCGLRIA